MEGVQGDGTRDTAGGSKTEGLREVGRQWDV